MDKTIYELCSLRSEAFNRGDMDEYDRLEPLLKAAKREAALELKNRHRCPCCGRKMPKSANGHS